MNQNIDSQRWQDLVLLSLAGIALCVECAVLLGQMRVIRLPFGWARDERAEPVIGEVVNKSRSVNSRSVSSLTWYPVVQGDHIHVDDTVMTGDDSSAVIKLGADEEIVLQPHTLVRFTANKTKSNENFLSFELNQGTVRVASRGTGRLRVRVPSREIELKSESEAIVTAAPLSAQADVRVNRGEVQITQVTALTDVERESTPGAAAPKTEPVIALRSGEAARLSPGRGLAKIDTKLTITPISPAPQSRVQAQGAYGNVHFRWEGARAEAVEWDESPEFSSPESVRANGIEATAQVKPGHFFWRVRQSIATSVAQEFTVLPRPSYRLIEPAPGTSLRAGAPVALQWEPISDATSYTLQVSDRADFSHLLREEALEGASKELPKMKPGKYWWRVSASHRQWGRLVASEPASFVVTKKRAAPPKPKGAKVLPAKTPAPPKDEHSSLWRKVWNFIEPEAYAEPKKTPTVWMDFEWDPSPDANRYRLEVSLDQNFKKPFVRRDISDTHAVVELPDTTKFFWRLASIDEDGDLGPFSDVQVMERSRAVTKEEAERRIAEAERKRQARLDKKKPRELASQKEEKKEPEKPRGPFWRTRSARLGYGASFLSRSQSTDQYTMAQSGFPMNQIRFGIAAALDGLDLELRGRYQGFRANAIEGKGTGELTYSDWNLEFLSPQTFGRWSLGVSIGAEGDFTRNANNVQLDVRSELVTSFLIGPRWILRQDRTHDWRVETLAELTPLVRRRGAGLVARGTMSFPRLLSESISPAFELNFHPHYRLGTDNGAKGFNFEVTAALSLTWLPTDGALF